MKTDPCSDSFCGTSLPLARRLLGPSLERHQEPHDLFHDRDIGLVRLVECHQCRHRGLVVAVVFYATVAEPLVSVLAKGITWRPSD